jgi:hypothetical protein
MAMGGRRADQITGAAPIYSSSAGHRIYRRRSTAGSGAKYQAVNIDRLFSDICGIVRKAGTLRVGDPFFDEGYAET